MSETGTPPVAGGWTIIFSLTSDLDPSKTFTQGEVGSLVGMWLAMRAGRKETVLSCGGAADDSFPNAFILYGRSEVDTETTLKILDELMKCIAQIFGLTKVLGYIGGRPYTVSRQEGAPPGTTLM